MYLRNDPCNIHCDRSPHSYSITEPFQTITITELSMTVPVVDKRSWTDPLMTMHYCPIGHCSDCANACHRVLRNSGTGRTWESHQMWSRIQYSLGLGDNTVTECHNGNRRYRGSPWADARRNYERKTLHTRMRCVGESTECNFLSLEYSWSNNNC